MRILFLFNTIHLLQSNLSTMKKLLLSVYLFLVMMGLYAQTETSLNRSQKRDFKNNPRWIALMNDSTVSYTTVVAAYEAYWSNKPLPRDILKGYADVKDYRSFIAPLFKSNEKYKQEIVQYTLDCKRYKYWKNKYAAYIKNDGTVMTSSEIDALIQLELANRKSTIK